MRSLVLASAVLIIFLVLSPKCGEFLEGEVFFLLLYEWLCCSERFFAAAVACA
jgi:hypothetical protein